jgi:Rrf2 family protein
MLDLAEHFSQGPVYLKDIARRQEISEKYLWQLANQLKTVGLIYTERGSRGGFALARDPGAITLKEIVNVLEGDLCVVDCVNGSKCKRMRMCPTRGIWQEVSQAVANTLESYTLKKLLEKEYLDKTITTYSI